MKKQAFTLIELLVVIVIIGILASIGVSQFNDYPERARTAKAQSESRDACTVSVTSCLETGQSNCQTMSDCMADAGLIINTITIGGLEIIDRNMGVGTMITGDSLATDGSEKWCPNNLESNCSTYDALYTWEAAMNVCPSGYRLPTSGEISSIIAEAANSYTTLQSLGFNATKSGYKNDSSHFIFTGSHANFWSSDSAGMTGGGFGAPEEAFYHFYSNGDTLYRGSATSAHGLGVRCVKD